MRDSLRDRLGPPADPASDVWIWSLPRAVLVCEIRTATVTLPHVESMITQMDALRREDEATLRALGGSRSVHDWRRVQRFELPARRKLMRAWEHRHPSSVRKVEVALAPSQIMQGLARVVSLVMVRHAHVRLDVVEDLDDRLEALLDGRDEL